MLIADQHGEAVRVGEPLVHEDLMNSAQELGLCSKCFEALWTVWTTCSAEKASL